MADWTTCQLRAAFAQQMAATYGHEVPAYNTLVDVAAEVNAAVLTRDGADAERLGSIGRVTAERHGAIRVGTPAELRAVAGSSAPWAWTRSASTTCATRRARRSP